MKYLLYFIIGGTIVSLVTYLASRGQGLFAAFIANLPVITVTTFITVYLTAGSQAVINYAKGLLLMLFPWLFYIICVILLTSKIGFPLALFIGLTGFFILSILILYL